MWREGNSHEVLVKMHIGAATVEKSMEFSQKIKNGTVGCQRKGGVKDPLELSIVEHL